jgi:hypothetical protein
MNIKFGIIAVLLVLIAILSINLYVREKEASRILGSFEECSVAGFAVSAGTLRTCTDGSGAVHAEEVVAPAPVEKVIEPTLTLAEAQALATTGACAVAGKVTTFEAYNQLTGTWWFALDAVRNGCSPACVVADAARTNEVNWRCTGARP